MSVAPGVIRDSIVDYLAKVGTDASIDEIVVAVMHRIGEVPASSVRSYLSLNTPKTFERVGRGRYRLKSAALLAGHGTEGGKFVDIGQARLHHADCFDWLAAQAPSSIHAVVTDPPYGLVEYTEKETTKLRAGKGGGLAHSPIV